jgi:hypothetical protein
MLHRVMRTDCAVCSLERSAEVERSVSGPADIGVTVVLDPLLGDPNDETLRHAPGAAVKP